MDNNHHDHSSKAAGAKVAWMVFAAIAAFYLLSEHRAHLSGALPFLLLLASPLMPLFMHGGHGGYSHGPTDKEADR